MESEKESSVSETASPTQPCCCHDRCRRWHGHCRPVHRWIGALLIIAILAFFAHSAYYGRTWDCTSRYEPRGSYTHFGAGDAPRVAGWMIDRLLYDAKASDAQRSKARAIVDTAAGDLQQLARQHGETHQALLALLKDPTFDRGKLESLRARSLSDLDESSKRLSTAVGDLVELLTPEQRQRVAESIEKWHRF